MSLTLNLFCLLGLAASCCMGRFNPHTIPIPATKDEISSALNNLVRSVDELQFTALRNRDYAVPRQLLSKPSPYPLQGTLVDHMITYQEKLMQAWKKRSEDELKKASEIVEIHHESNFLATLLARRSKAYSNPQEYDDSGLVYQSDAYEFTTVLNEMINKLRSDPQKKVELRTLLTRLANNLPASTSIMLVFEIEKRLAKLTTNQLKMIGDNLKSLEGVELDRISAMPEWPVWINSNTGLWHWLEFCEDYRHSDEGRTLLEAVHKDMSSKPAAAAEALPLTLHLRNNLDSGKITAGPKFNLRSSL